MKKVFKIFATLSALLLAAVFMTIGAAAEEVIFIADGGSGDGSSPDSPLGSAPEHETWSLEAYSYNAINLAIAKLAENGKGGTIVVSGPVSIKYGRQAEKDARSASDFRLTPKLLEAASLEVADPSINIKFTSVYDGVDYREKNNAAIVIERTAEQAICLEMRVASEWENLTFKINNTPDRSMNGANLTFSCFNQKTVIGDGIVTESFVDGIKVTPEAQNASFRNRKAP